MTRTQTHRHHLSRYKRISPRTARVGLIIVGFVLAIDILAARFSAEIQSALTLPAAQIKFAASPHVAPTAQARVTVPTPQLSPVPATSPSPAKKLALPPKNMLAQDTFQRPNQASWGVASDGQAWGADARTSQNFAIVNHAGQVTNGNGVYDAVLGPRATNAEVVMNGSLTHYVASSLGPVLRWTDANNLYKVFLGGGQLILLKKVAGVVTVLKTVPFSAQDGTAYTFRFRAIGPQLEASVWPAGKPEPSNWMISVTDNDLQSGYGGMRIVEQSGTTATITSFTETSL